MNPLNQEARRLREEIYGSISDSSWEKIAENWCADIDFLRAQKPLRCAYPVKPFNPATRMGSFAA